MVYLGLFLQESFETLVLVLIRKHSGYSKTWHLVWIMDVTIMALASFPVLLNP